MAREHRLRQNVAPVGRGDAKGASAAGGSRERGESVSLLLPAQPLTNCCFACLGRVVLFRLCMVLCLLVCLSAFMHSPAGCPWRVLQVYAVAFQGDGSLIATGDLGGVARVWDLRSGKSILNLRVSVDRA
jgi:hypothetical protein